MESVSSKYLGLMSPHIKPRDPSLPFYSSVTNQILSKGAELGPQYWVNNLVSPVKFSTAVSKAIQSSQGDKIFLEIGPHAALAGPIRQIFASEKPGNEYINVLTRSKDSHEEVLRAVGQLWLYNYPIALDKVVDKGKFLTDLPSYPWYYEEPLWYESRLSREYRLREFPHHELLGTRILESTTANPAWRNILRLENVPWIAQHEIEGSIVLPGISYLCMAGEAIRQLTGKVDFTCQQVHIKAALLLTEDGETEVVTQLTRVNLTDAVESEWYDFSVSSYHNGGWIKHCFGQVRGGDQESGVKIPNDTAKTYSRVCSSKSWYRKFRSLGLNYGPRFTPIKNMTTDPLKPRLAASLTIDLLPGEERYYSVHPGTLDGLVQGLYPAAVSGQTKNFDQLALITYVDEFYMNPPPQGSKELKFQVDITEQRPAASIGDVVATAEGGSTVVRSRGWQIASLNDADDTNRDENPHGAAELEWKEDISFIEASSLIKRAGNKTESYRLMDRLDVLCMAQSVERLRGTPPPTREYLTKFHQWLEDTVSDLATGKSTCHGVPDADKLVTMPAKQRTEMIEQLYSSTLR